MSCRCAGWIYVVDWSTPKSGFNNAKTGCGFGLVFVENGELFVEFDRNAESYDRAVASAMENIKTAGGTVTFTERTRS